MTEKVSNVITTAVIAVTVFVIGEVIGGFITAYIVRKYGCPLAADYKAKENVG